MSVAAPRGQVGQVHFKSSLSIPAEVIVELFYSYIKKQKPTKDQFRPLELPGFQTFVEILHSNT